MSRSLMRHPDGDQLLRYADGELSARKAREVRAHLEACWQCRTELDEIHGTVRECVRYRKNVLQEGLPPAPAPWFDIYRQFDNIDAAESRASIFTRLARLFEFRNARRWAPAAVALALVAALLYQWRDTPSVQAAELLRKAVAAAETHPAAPRRIQIRTSRKRAQNDPALQAMFQAARYSWEDPLSARSYLAWHDQLSEKRDEVTTEPNGYRIRTTTGSGDLMEASLKLSRPDLRPVEGRLEFRNREWVEITELPAEEAAPPAPAPEPEIAANRPPASSTVPNATLGDELQVLAALHQVGADLGDPIDVTRSGGRILVSGVGIAPQRRQQIQHALGAMPKVVVRFSEPAAEPEAAERPASGEPPVALEAQKLQERIAEQLGGRIPFERLAAQVVDMSDAVMSRAYALRRLAQRFPPAVEAELSPADRRVLRDLGQEHAAVLGRQTAEIERLLEPVLAPLGGSAGAAENPIAATAWQPAAEELFRAARRVEAQLAALLGSAAHEVPGDRFPSQILVRLGQLRAGAQACERLAAQGAPGR